MGAIEDFLKGGILISIPDAVFKAAEKHAKRMHKSRSRLFSEAIVEYLDRHTPDEITRMLNETLKTICARECLAKEKGDGTGEGFSGERIANCCAR
ncbi:MAG: ribbon-helix-helix domain-containing protein [Candidatus Scalindua sp.]|nr:ribbon-helix-helix domain-containing protein [Candidatus Scalindua sp.]MCR4344623.1 ribbon-helix-helix domain-containing protein [Candidatus Scalindua sp.]